MVFVTGIRIKLRWKLYIGNSGMTIRKSDKNRIVRLCARAMLRGNIKRTTGCNAKSTIFDIKREIECASISVYEKSGMRLQKVNSKGA